jgi:hypothetical protein
MLKWSTNDRQQQYDVLSDNDKATVIVAEGRSMAGIPLLATASVDVFIFAAVDTDLFTDAIKH